MTWKPAIYGINRAMEKNMESTTLGAIYIFNDVVVSICFSILSLPAHQRYVFADSGVVGLGLRGFNSTLHPA